MLLDPAPHPHGTCNTAALSHPSSVTSLSFVHAAACSALISSVKKMSGSRSNIAGKGITSSHHCTPAKPNTPAQSKSSESVFHFYGNSERKYHFLEPVKSIPSPGHTKEKRKLKLISKHGKFSQSLPTPGGSPGKTNPCLGSSCVSKDNINITFSDTEFQASSPTCYTAPVLMDTSVGWQKDLTLHNAENDTLSQVGYLTKHLAGSMPCLHTNHTLCQQNKYDGTQFETICLPEQSMNLKKNPLYLEKSVEAINVMHNTSLESNKASFYVVRGEPTNPSNAPQTDASGWCSREPVSLSSHKNSPFAWPEVPPFSKWPSLSHMNQQSNASQQGEFQNSFHARDKLSKSSKIFSKIFRSKSEDLLNKESEKNYSKDVTSETILSPVPTHTLLTRSSSEDILDRVTEKPVMKKYCIKNSVQDKVKEPPSAPTRRHKLIKPLHAVFSADFKSLANLKKKMTRSKSHNFTSGDTEVSSHFYLERANSDQNFQNEMSENKHPTLQRCTCDKETYFPSATKKILSSKKCDSHRIYQVNEPSLSSCKKFMFKVKSSKDNILEQSVANISQDSHPLAHHTCIDGRLTYVKKSANHILNTHSLAKKNSWFEKYKINKTKTHDAQNFPLNDSFERSVLSTSEDSSHEVTPQAPLSGNSPGNSSLTDTVNLLVKYKSQPEVHKRIADKLTSIIRELEEEIGLTVPSRQHSDVNINRNYDLQKPQANPVSSVVKTSSLPSRRPSSLFLERQMCRTNSAPTLSPIEEVRALPQGSGGAYLESGFPIAESSVPNGIKQANWTCAKRGQKFITSLRSKSVDENHDREVICVPLVNSGHQHSLSCQTVASSPKVVLAPCHDSQFEGESELQPRSLVVPAPVTYCDEYDNEKEVAYV